MGTKHFAAALALLAALLGAASLPASLDLAADAGSLPAAPSRR